MRNGFFLLLILVVAFSGCSNDSVTDNAPPAPTTGGTGGTGTGDGADDPKSATITVTASPATGLSALGTATVSATVLDGAGLFVPDGTVVSFGVGDPSLGEITPMATTVSGVATATFTASNTAGTVILTATSGAVSDTASVSIVGAAIGSIQFVSASPDVIGVKGSGQAETAIMTFSIRDINGQPVGDGINVSFSLSGPQGGEALNPATASTKGGQVQTTLQSGSVAGPIRITATTTLNGVTVSSASTSVSIGGGVPSMAHFSFARSTVNLAGLVYDNLQSTLTAFLADRFGNFNVLKGTSVSFYTEAGAVDASSTTEETGIASVLFRTQNPRPLVFSSAPLIDPAFPSLNNAENLLLGNPANGLARVIAVTRGEECFVDKNGNGLFDAVVDGFPTGCDISEPFIDQDDDGIFDPGNEQYIDGNKNGVFDGPNGIWDENRMIWRSLWIVFSGEPSITVVPDTVNVGNLGSQSFDICVADVNANSPMAGSTVAVTTTKGTLVGGGPFTIPDRLSGPYCLNVNLSDTTNETDPPQPVSLEISATWKVPGHGDLVIDRRLDGTIN